MACSCKEIQEILYPVTTVIVTIGGGTMNQVTHGRVITSNRSGEDHSKVHVFRVTVVDLP